MKYYYLIRLFQIYQTLILTKSASTMSYKNCIFFEKFLRALWILCSGTLKEVHRANYDDQNIDWTHPWKCYWHSYLLTISRQIKSTSPAKWCLWTCQTLKKVMFLIKSLGFIDYIKANFSKKNLEGDLACWFFFLTYWLETAVHVLEAFFIFSNIV